MTDKSRKGINVVGGVTGKVMFSHEDLLIARPIPGVFPYKNRLKQAGNKLTLKGEHE